MNTGTGGSGKSGGGVGAAGGRADAPAGTIGQQLKRSPVVAEAVGRIVAEVRAKSALLTGARPAADGLKQSYEEFMKRAADVRGRGLLYPYLGSGVGNGALVELLDGSVKWDMICGIGVHFFGHSDAELIGEAVKGAVDDTLKYGNLQSNFEAYEFCETLLNEAKKHSRLRHCYVATSGAMANENALKVCYQRAQVANGVTAPRVIAFKDCFMGRSVTMSQIGDTAAYRQGLPLSTLVDYMPFYDPVAAERMGKTKYIDMCVWHLMQYIERYPKQHACFIFEMVQGEGGFNVGDRDYFKALMECCKAHKIAVWDDEIQTWGRLPRMFAYEVFDLGQYVDVFCVGKMTQACVTAFTEDFNPQPGLLSGTFLGEGVSFKVGQRVIERLRDGDYYGPSGRIARLHEGFVKQVHALAKKHPAWFPKVAPPHEIPDIAGGLGGMMRFTPFGGNKDKIMKACKTCFEEGVIVFYCGHGPHHIRMLPPLGVFQEKDWPAVFECIERGLARAAE
jgi:4-aminobutyrate aminotransferase-like enzyme